MDRIPVSSSNVASIGYDVDTQVLDVEFVNGGVYQYMNVPQEAFDELQSAASKGRYVAQNVKNRYPYTRVG
jgi:uncharacterized protein